MIESAIQFALLITQFVAILVLFGEILYISHLKASKYQVDLILLLASTLVMLVGYTMELFSHSSETALYSAALSYVGKPFALLMLLVFIADFCGKPLPRFVTIPLSIIALSFPILVFSNGYEEGIGHHLYYATISTDLDQLYSPLEVTRGPLYFTYMVFLVGILLAVACYIIVELKRAQTKQSRRSLIYIIAMFSATIVGYVVYILGLTNGYDTTMTGAAISTILLSIAFFRFKLFDSLNLAKEQALHNASMGLLVLNERGIPEYTNAQIDSLLKEVFTADELLNREDGEGIIKKNDRVYEIKKDSIKKHGHEYGKTIEIKDITIKYNYNESLERAVEERTKEICSIQRAITASFAELVEARDNSTGFHIKHMSKYVELIAQSMLDHGDYPEILTQEYLERIIEVSPLHDIGKLTIPDRILGKPDILTDEERDIIKTHSAAGERIIEECLGGVERPEYVTIAKEIARHHHERWNGEGYPDKLSGQDIPLCARIVMVADVYDAIRSERCYKPPIDKIEARRMIEEDRAVRFDPVVVDAFLRVIDKIEEI